MTWKKKEVTGNSREKEESIVSQFGLLAIVEYVVASTLHQNNIKLIAAHKGQSYFTILIQIN